MFAPQRRVFDRETTGDWELGAKTSWLDHALTLNVTLYRMDIKGFQDRGFDGTSFTVRNAGNLRHQGVEFDAVARPIRNLSLFANVAYLDSNFTDYPFASGLPGCAPSATGVIPPACVAAGLGATQDLKGKPATFAPKWSGRVGFDWTGNFGSSGLSWDLNSNLSFVSKQYGGLQNDANPQTILDGHALLGARLSREWSGRPLDVRTVRQQPAQQAIFGGRPGAVPRRLPGPSQRCLHRKHCDPQPACRSAHDRSVLDLPLLM